MTVSEADVLKALGDIVGPDGRSPVSRSNGISGLTIRNGKVFLALTGNPRLAAAMETMRSEAETQIKALPGVAGAVVTLTSEKPAGAASPPPPSPAARPAPPRNIAIPGSAPTERAAASISAAVAPGRE